MDIDVINGKNWTSPWSLLCVSWFKKSNNDKGYFVPVSLLQFHLSVPFVSKLSSNHNVYGLEYTKNGYPYYFIDICRWPTLKKDQYKKVIIVLGSGSQNHVRM